MMTTGARGADGGLTERGLPAPPAALLNAVEERCRALAATAVGRVFRVPADDVESALRSECGSCARYDTILSFMRTPQVADIEGFVAALEAILADDGWILMVEPARTGGTGRIGGLPEGWLPRRLRRQYRHGDRPDRGIVSALRAGGFTVTDIHRRDAPTAPARWRRYVEVRARRESPWGVEVSPTRTGEPDGEP